MQAPVARAAAVMSEKKKKEMRWKMGRQGRNSSNCWTLKLEPILRQHPTDATCEFKIWRYSKTTVLPGWFLPVAAIGKDINH